TAILGIAVLAGGVLVAAVYLSRPSVDVPADIIYENGVVLSMDGENSIAAAFAVSGERIAGVGSNWYVSAWKGQGTRIVDLKGKTVVPGFIDAHGHFPEAGVIALYRADLRSPPMGSVKSLEDVHAVLAEKAAQTPPGEWIVGVGYDDTLLAENRHPTKQDLDAVSTRHPIFVWHTSLHLGVANSLALELSGITKRSLDTPGGVIHRDPDSGEPTGLLEEIPAMLPVLSQMPDPGLEGRLAAIEKAAEIYHAEGVTSAQTGYMDAASFPALLAAVESGLIKMRLDVWPAAQVIKEWMRGDGIPEAPETSSFRMKTAKIVGDGSIQGYTGYLSRPYHVPPEDKPDWRGYPAMPREQLVELVRDMHEAGFQVAVHGNGDAAIDDILAAFENLHADHVEEDLRPIIVHAQMARQDLLQAMADLGVIPSFFNLHTYYWGDR
ncbi:MAG: amidohydrolase, partial [Alphaproteobacteria bacterium]|nr:amidohydrolase [Alphaproteobacteria bacterium]